MIAGDRPLNEQEPYVIEYDAETDTGLAIKGWQSYRVHQGAVIPTVPQTVIYIDLSALRIPRTEAHELAQDSRAEDKE